MKKLIVITGVILVLSVIVNAEIIPALAKQSAAKPEKNNQTLVDEIQPDPYTGYVVKEFNGKIAVFEKGVANPYRMTDMPVSFLPDYDKNLLVGGIELDSQDEVNRVLEDYLS